MVNMCLRSHQLLLLLALVAGSLSCTREQTATPQRRTVQEAVFASGEMVQDEEYIIASTVDGIIREMYVEAGDSVKPGQLLLRVKSDIQHTQLDELQIVYQDAQQKAAADAPQLSQLQAQIRQAESQLTQDETNYRRYRELREKNSVSQLDLEKAQLLYEASRTNVELLQKNYQELAANLQLNVERSRAQLRSQQVLLDEYRIEAEKSGIAISINKKTGELVRKGEVVGRIGSGPYVLKMYVAEEDIARVRIGQSVAVHLNTYPDQTFVASISRILPGFDLAEQSYVVEATLQEQPEQLFSGTQLQANIDVGTRENVLVIPTVFLEKGKYVTLHNGAQKMIEVGNKNREWTEVLSGLEESDILLRAK